MNEIINTLENYADDAFVEIGSLSDDSLVLLIELPSRGNEKWELKFDNVVHFDMNPSFTLGSTKLGGIELLPKGYIETRNFDYGGDLKHYQVIKFIDIDHKAHFITYIDEISLSKKAT